MTASSFWGNPTEPMTQGLFGILPPFFYKTRCIVTKNDNGSPRERQSYWTLKITLITFLIAALFSFAADLATNHSDIIFAVILLFFLIILSIVFDCIAVAVTSCDKAPLASMAARKISGSKIALKLTSNAHKVSSICSDVIGDICGIISGACLIVVVLKVITMNPNMNTMIVTLLFSSTVAAVTVGGKAIMKTVAINKSKEIVMLVSKFLHIFIKEK